MTLNRRNMKISLMGDQLSSTISGRLGGLMRNIGFGTNVTVFVIFFGLSLIDAIWSHHWVGALLWLGFGLLFVRGDSPKRVA